MCKGPNEPGGPHRCGGHARTAMQEASSAAAEARMLERAANAERSATEAAHVDHNDAKVNLQREYLRTEDPEQRAKLAEQIDSEARIEDRMAEQERRATKAWSEAKQASRTAELRNSEALYAYDATTEGLMTLTNEFNQRNTAWQRSVEASSVPGVGTELTHEQSAELAELQGLSTRREKAERRMAEEAMNRNGAQIESAEGYAEYEEMTDALGEHKAAGQIIYENEGTPEEIAEAKERLASAQATIDAARKRDRARSMLQPYKAADQGEFRMLEEPVWTGVSSGHRNVVGADGKPKVQVVLQRDVDGVRTQKVFETDAAPIMAKREAILASADRDASHTAQRYPTTTEVLRGLGQDFGRLNSKGRTWGEFKANGGSREDFDRAVTAQRVLSGLFGGSKAETSVEERELIDA
ncbi:hypothetical protein GCM10025867_50480 (plasmid) [Frondihabitans sucicola]|uniref:Uncharacterized protein n=1 Tax=Frondihabitans sucicola TaxID=1268041 RepID=A0ABM8GWP9_9MICO|nr:hypothetical protein [Frondihabitans sucicola]BDZ52807.1 hypothetical protein GCM10025867_50480 [Frondihabitans sucicola]